LANAPLENFESEVKVKAREDKLIIEEKKVQPEQSDFENGPKPINPYSSMFIFGPENW
jgi:hypothetical protein